MYCKPTLTVLRVMSEDAIRTSAEAVEQDPSRKDIDWDIGGEINGTL